MEIQGSGPPGGRAELTCVAVDWSGRTRDAEQFIWTAEVGSGRLRGLRNGRSRAGVGDLLIEIATATPRLAVGLDFAFSFPSWYLDRLGVGHAGELWELAAAQGEGWLAARATPFWGWPGGTRPIDQEHFRRTEANLARATGGIGPKSPFQIGGAGSVGTGSIRGMPLLARLRREGFSIWPFDENPGWPRVVEIYPRLHTGPVRKSAAAARHAHLEALGWPADRLGRALVASTEDAFDAALSARAMDRHQECLATLPVIPEECAVTARREGWIWSP
ncbi:MAG TPA: hypothetical protein VKY26_11210 [Actinomycetota bacterium]|nr:hypothetical protein [Actinomycetota bacterium]